MKRFVSAALIALLLAICVAGLPTGCTQPEPASEAVSVPADESHTLSLSDFSLDYTPVDPVVGDVEGLTDETITWDTFLYNKHYWLVTAKGKTADPETGKSVSWTNYGLYSKRDGSCLLPCSYQDIMGLTVDRFVCKKYASAVSDAQQCTLYDQAGKLLLEAEDIRFPQADCAIGICRKQRSKPAYLIDKDGKAVSETYNSIDEFCQDGKVAAFICNKESAQSNGYDPAQNIYYDAQGKQITKEQAAVLCNDFNIT